MTKTRTKARKKAAGSKATAATVRTSVSEVVRGAYRLYGEKTIEDRALPDVRDGLLPVQRHVLWAAHVMGLRPDRAYRKSSNLVGAALGGYHATGEQSIYGAMVGMVTAPLPLLDGSGSWGQPAIDTEAASSRYTECKLSRHAQELLLDPRLLAATKMVPNFDGSLQEPLVLPAKLPVLLLTGSIGIAVGATAHIPAFTYDSVRKATIAALKNGGIVLPKHISGLELTHTSRGEALLTPEGAKSLLSDNAAKVEWTGRFEKSVKTRTLHVTGLPPQWAYKSGINKLRGLDNVKQVQDLSAGGDIHLAVVLRPRLTGKDTKDVSKALGKIEDTFRKSLTYRFNVTERKIKNEDGVIETTAVFSKSSVLGIFKAWMEWRLELEKDAAREVVLGLEADLRRENLLQKALRRFNGLIKIVRDKSIKDKNAAVCKLLDVASPDAAYVLSQPLSRFDTLSEESIKAKVDKIKAGLKQAVADINNPSAAALRGLVADMNRRSRKQAS